MLTGTHVISWHHPFSASKNMVSIEEPPCHLLLCGKLLLANKLPLLKLYCPNWTNKMQRSLLLNITKTSSQCFNIPSTWKILSGNLGRRLKMMLQSYRGTLHDCPGSQQPLSVISIVLEIACSVLPVSSGNIHSFSGLLWG